jgi:hypothetical protein
MTPPEVILDRWVKIQSRRQPKFADYMGKLDLNKVEPSSLRSFLSFLQGSMTSALTLENTNASGGTPHPPFHFDYLEVKGGIRNALAFQYEGFSFIAVTLPLVQLLWDNSTQLTESATVRHLLKIDLETTRLEALRALLFQFQLTFLVSHEYTHHVHQHCSGEESEEIWTEYFQEKTIGGLDSQAQELDADGYALYLVLANFVGGGARESALAQLGRQDVPGIEADELLLTCFFVALTGFFCALWPEDIKIASIYNVGHPPAPVRIEYAIRVAQMWCAQNQSLPESWFSAERFKSIFDVATQCVHGGKPEAWDKHVSFLQSAAGKEYDRLLLERFEVIRNQGSSRNNSSRRSETTI